MNPRLQRLQAVFRAAGVLQYIESARFRVKQLQVYYRNRSFRHLNPDFALPPAHLAFDAYGHVDWCLYRDSGVELAQRLLQEIDQVRSDQALASPLQILEWGCGPARIIRHLPSLIQSAELHGSDYNSETINWCKSAIPGVTFVENSLLPPLPFPSSGFGVIYAVSVLTHLSEAACMQWSRELTRVLRQDGILIIWTNSDSISRFLLPEEKEKYNQSQCVVRARYREGRKMYLSFHPPEWVRNVLLTNYEVLRHYPGGFLGNEQDVWVSRVHK